ncbi:MAG: GUN4 domain-containing protein [Cyanobacteriota bacterium]|nr:GUN4 domain-containing protein [Cyanobacteriota bacterium]
MEYNHREIRKLIDEALGEEEVNNLFFDYFGKNPTNGQKSNKIRTLIEDALKKERINEVLKEIEDINPKRFNDYKDKILERVDLPSKKIDEQYNTDEPNHTKPVVNQTIKPHEEKLPKKQSPDPPITKPVNKDPSISPPNKNQIDIEEISLLRSELLELLKKQEWEEADKKTTEIMQKVARKYPGEDWGENDIMNFPTDILDEIDRIWKKCSGEKFCFSIQASIWNNCKENREDSKRYEFAEEVGWYERNQQNWLSWADGEDFRKKVNKNQKGILPTPPPFSNLSRINVKLMNKLAIKMKECFSN